MAVAEWIAGELVQPGDIRRPVQTGDVSQYELDNPFFESGDTGWTWGGTGGSGVIDTTSPVFTGSYSARAGYTDNPNGTYKTLTNDAQIAVDPGDAVSITCFIYAPVSSGQPGRCKPEIEWFNASNVSLGTEKLPLDTTNLAGESRINANGIVAYAFNGTSYLPLVVSGVAPANAAYFKVKFTFYWGDFPFSIGGVQLDYAQQAAPNTLLYRATQAEAGFTGNSEPAWPLTVGQTVVDNEVTWTAIAGNNITWEASRILVTGSSEPTWPTGADATVIDNTIVWVLDPRRVTDTKCPNNAIALIGASKVFSADDDLVRYCATVNPLDWTTSEDAGYVPYGLQKYGAEGITAMGLYRGNLAVFNTEGCQVWQIDPDPSAIALLDAVPVECKYPLTVQPAGDDLLLLSTVGVRSLGTAGAAVNLQAGYLGKPVDDLVVARLEEAETNAETILALYWPAQGQYWLILGDEAFVLTINGSTKNDRVWARYTFPSAIDYWTILEGNLYLRSGDLVWLVDKDATLDDQRTVSGATVGTNFQGVIQWPALDFGRPGIDKTMHAFDLSIEGAATVYFGWNQADQDYAVDGDWTEGYAVTGDTISGSAVPFEMTGPTISVRIVFDANQAWKWHAMNIYANDTRAQ